MRRRQHRRIQYYNAEPTRARLQDKPWFPFAIVALAALVAALIAGAIFGGVARRSDRDSLIYRDLAEFGGVEEPAEKFGGLYTVTSLFVDHEGMDRSAVRGEVQELTGGNAAAFWVYDGQGGTFFQSLLADKTGGVMARAYLSAKDLVSAADADGRYAVGYLMTGAFYEADEQLRLLKTAQEMALIAELADAGMREIVIVGLSTKAEYADRVNDYVRQAYGLCGHTYLSVMVPAEADKMARLVGATEGYVDGYFMDAREYADKELTRAVTECAYYLTLYNMRLVLSDADREASENAAASFGIKSYQLMPAGMP